MSKNLSYVNNGVRKVVALKKHLRCGHDLLLENAPRKIAELKPDKASDNARAGNGAEQGIDPKCDARERRESTRAMRGTNRGGLVCQGRLNIEVSGLLRHTRVRGDKQEAKRTLPN